VFFHYRMEPAGRVPVGPLALTLVMLLAGCGGSDRKEESGAGGTLKETKIPPRIDAHAHIHLPPRDETWDAPFMAMLEAENMKWFTICTGGLDWEGLQEEVEAAGRLHARYPDRVAWATSFNLTNWGDPDWEKETIAFIAEGFEGGAVAVKVWKEVGMVLKDPDGSFVMIDDPRFDPILDYIEGRDRTLVCHIGEPRNCWLPLEEMTVNGDREYFSNHPEYHAYLHPEIPDYWKQIASRDHMLEKHPNLRVVGCHLGSLEYDTDELAKRLDRYPNFAVDTAARIILRSAISS